MGRSHCGVIIHRQRKIGFNIKKRITKALSAYTEPNAVKMTLREGTYRVRLICIIIWTIKYATVDKEPSNTVPTFFRSRPRPSYSSARGPSSL